MATSSLQRLMAPPRLVIAVVGSLLLLFLLFSTRTQTHIDRIWRAGPASSDDRLLADVFNSTLGFEEIFVLSLPSRTDRRDATSLAAALTGFQFEYIDGVTTDQLNLNALPPGGAEFPPEHHGALAAWRAHMNAIRTIVDRNLTSALILEDDVDWDVRLKSQLRDFAKASRLLTQPSSSGDYLDPSYPVPKTDQKPVNFDLHQYGSYAQLPTTSPYGDVDKWDMLWLGHCGTRLPVDPASKVPLGRIVISNDETVAEHRHLEPQWGGHEVVDEYPQHTRVVSRSVDTTCTLAYAVSNAGARRMLYEFGVRQVSAAADILFRQMCQGTDHHGPRNCFSVQPELFDHHRPRGSNAAMSDIGHHEDSFNNVASTVNIRMPVRVNFEALIDGGTDLIDQYPDATV